jgi:hypothetical protein
MSGACSMNWRGKILRKKKISVNMSKVERTSDAMENTWDNEL